MKQITSLIVAIIVSVCTGFVATHTKAQTSSNDFVANIDTASLGKASPSFSIQIIRDSNTQKFVLIVNNPEGEKLQLSICAASTPGFRDQINEATYSKKIDMTRAADDYYTITVSNKKQQVTKNFMLQTLEDNNRSISID